MQQTQISSPKYDRRVGFSFGAALNNSVLKLYLFIYLFVVVRLEEDLNIRELIALLQGTLTGFHWLQFK